MTTNPTSMSLDKGRIYSHTLLSLMLIFGMIARREEIHQRSDQDFISTTRSLRWDVNSHKVKSRSILSLELTHTMGTGKDRLLTGCYTSGTISIYEEQNSALKEVRTLGRVKGGITDIKLLSMDGSWNKAVAANQDQGIISIFDIHEDSPPMTLFHGPQGVEMIAIADLNGDGLGDIIPVSYEGKTNVWFQNDQHQGFVKRHFSSTKSKVTAVQVADFDNDGDQDMLMASDHEKRISLLINDGQGNFTEATLEESVSGVLDMAVLDMNMDGAMDLAYVSYKEKNVQLLLNNGNKFEREKISTKLRSLNNIRVFDLAYDGRPDLIVSSFDDNTIRVIENSVTGLKEHQLQAHISSPIDVAVKTDRDTGETMLYVSSMAKNRVYTIDIVLTE